MNRLKYLRYHVLVNAALKLETRPKLMIAEQHCADFIPKRTLASQVVHITDQIKTSLCSRESDANTVLSFEKTNVGFFVTPHKRENNNVVFFSLKVINH